MVCVDESAEMSSKNLFEGFDAAPDPRARFWSSEFLWPEDTINHMFLARAVHIVGNRIYGEKWTGQEPLAENFDPLPAALSASTDASDTLRGSKLLVEHSAEYRQRCAALSRLAMPTDEEWTLAVSIAKLVSDDRRQAVSRYLDICHRLARTFRNGIVQTSARAFNGGPEQPLDWSLWNTEYHWSRFDCCRIDPNQPFDARPAWNGGHWLFVEITSFERALRRHQDENYSSAELEALSHVYLSPYVRCMIEASTQLGLTLENQSKTEVLISEIPKFWRHAAELSGRDLNSMATLMREPESKAGRGKKARKKP